MFVNTTLIRSVATHCWPVAMVVPTTGKPKAPSWARSDTESFAPTQMMPARSTVVVQRERPGLNGRVGWV